MSGKTRYLLANVNQERRLYNRLDPRAHFDQVGRRITQPAVTIMYGERARSLDEAQRIAAKLGYPVYCQWHTGKGFAEINLIESEAWLRRMHCVPSKWYSDEWLTIRAARS